jgi:hypothetical protein
MIMGIFMGNVVAHIYGTGRSIFSHDGSNYINQSVKEDSDDEIFQLLAPTANFNSWKKTKKTF